MNSPMQAELGFLKRKPFIVINKSEFGLRPLCTMYMYTDDLNIVIISLLAKTVRTHSIRIVPLEISV